MSAPPVQIEAICQTQRICSKSMVEGAIVAAPTARPRGSRKPYRRHGHGFVRERRSRVGSGGVLTPKLSILALASPGGPYGLCLLKIPSAAAILAFGRIGVAESAVRSGHA